jgi:hypothetical protein
MNKRTEEAVTKEAGMNAADPAAVRDAAITAKPAK